MKLRNFLYVLIRDEVTIGKVERIMKDMIPNADEEVRRMCPELDEYAGRLAGRLLEE